jgi:hypothetical protein
VSYSNINNPANYQLQSFGQDGMRTISTTQAYVEGEYYRVLVATEDSTLSATSMVGDDLASIEVYAGTTIYGLFTAVTVTAGEVTAYLAGRTDIDDVWAYIRAYGVANGAVIEGEDCAKAAISPLLDKYYAKASLVMVPSLYKTSIVYSERPLSTDGQLAFTRASNATRVAPDGLIEKVRTNLALYSEQFDNAYWTKSQATITANATTAPDGTLTAEKFIEGSGSVAPECARTPIATSNSIFTLSVFAKASERNFLIINNNDGTGSFRVWFNLTTGVIGTTDAGVTAFIENVGNGWFRCGVARQMTAFASATSAFQIGSADGVDTYTGDGTSGIFIWGAQMELSDFGPTDYIPTTTTAVSVGPVANLPRLNYPINSDGSVGCPSLLLEPQTTALNQFSEQLDNAYWTKSNSTATANQTASPSGYVDAELILDDTSNAQHAISTSIAVTSGNKYTASFFLKAAGYTTSAIRMGVGALWTGGTGPTVEFDLVALTGTVVDGSGVTFTIEDYGNGWRRCSVTGTCVTSGNTAYSLYVKQYNAYIGSGTDGVYAWGANITATDYLQSYIPTYGASVTRLAEVCGKTGISSLIGQTEGVLFAEINTNTDSTDKVFSINNGISGSGNSRLWMGYSTASKNVYALGYVNNTLQFVFSKTMTDESIFVKIACKYAVNDAAFYVNGVQEGTDTSALAFSGLNSFNFNIGTGAGAAANFYGNVKQILIFPTVLTDAQLAELTTL